MTSSQADGYVFVKDCRSCPLNSGEGYCLHPTTERVSDPDDAPKDKAHPECPLRKHSLHIALEPTA